MVLFQQNVKKIKIWNTGYWPWLYSEPKLVRCEFVCLMKTLIDLYSGKFDAIVMSKIMPEFNYSLIHEFSYSSL